MSYSKQVRFILLLFSCLQVHLTFAAKDCPAGWMKWDTKCFYANDTSLDFEENMQACERLGGTAVSIHSEEENNFVGDKVLKADVYYCLGLRQVQYGVDSFAWADGSMFEYNNWGAGKPPGLKSRCFSSEIRNKLWYGFACTSNCRLFCQIQLDGEDPSPTSNRVIDQIVVEQLSLKKAVSKVETQLIETTKSVSALASKVVQLPLAEQIQTQIKDTQEMVHQRAEQLTSQINSAQNQINDNLNKEKAVVMREITSVNRSIIHEVAQCRQYVDKKGQENVALLQKVLNDKESAINSVVNQAAVKTDQLSQRLSTFEVSNENYKKKVDNLDKKLQHQDDRIREMQIDAGNVLAKRKTVEAGIQDSINELQNNFEKISNSYQNLESTVNFSLSQIRTEATQKLAETTHKVNENSADMQNIAKRMVTLEATLNKTMEDVKDSTSSIDHGENISQLKIELNQKQKELQAQIDANSRRDIETSQKVASVSTDMESLRKSLLNTTSHQIPNLEDKLSATVKELHNYNEKLQKIFSELSGLSHRHLQTDKSLKSFQMALQSFDNKIGLVRNKTMDMALQSLDLKIDLIRNKTLDIVLKKIAGKNIVYKDELEQEHYRTLFVNGLTLLASLVLFTLVVTIYVVCRNRNDRKAAQLRSRSYEVFETQLNTLLK